ncbi:MAG: HlyD family efflux transporter periplasmic adaptor subunit [Pirellulales bacterium]|nr:HlyD family efflux transporter periplasmic adaptor subunit [Pirellulales bacterium]
MHMPHTRIRAAGPLVVGGALAWLLAAPGALAQEITIPRCPLDLIEERDVPAQDAGMLLELDAREGAVVEQNMRLGAIDDREAQAELIVAQREYDVAKEKAENDVNVRYAEAAAKVAEYTYLQNKSANDKVPGTVSQTEVLKTLFDWKRSKLQIEQAQSEMAIAALELKAAEAKQNAMKVKVDRRQILAPISGMITKVERKPGTWVNPGDPIVRIIYLERLRVKGHVESADYSPSVMLGRAVKVKVQLPAGPRGFTGKVVFCNPEIDLNGKFEVWAEIDNPQEDGRWTLHPGLTSEMSIDMSGVAPPVAPEAAQTPVGATPSTRRTATKRSR